MLALQNGIFGVPGYGVAAGNLLQKNPLPIVADLPSGAEATVAALILSKIMPMPIKKQRMKEQKSLKQDLELKDMFGKHEI